MVKGMFVAQVGIDFSLDKELNTEEFQQLKENMKNQWKDGIKVMIEDDMSDLKPNVTVTQTIADVVQYDENACDKPDNYMSYEVKQT